MRRKFLLVLALLACRPPAPPPAEPTAPPDPFVSAVDKLDDPETRAAAFEELYGLLHARPDDDAFVDAVIPAFARLWRDAPDYRLSMLSLLAELARPEASTIWRHALVLDGTRAAIKRAELAVHGIRSANATTVALPLAAALDKLRRDPTLDEDGSLRVTMCDTLGDLGEPTTFPALRRTLRSDGAPPLVYRAAARALGRAGDPESIDDLLALGFRVTDSPSFDNVTEQARRALAHIGPSAVPAARQMLRGVHALVEDIARDRAIARPFVTMQAARILGAIGSPEAVDDLLEAMPSCTASEPNTATSTLRLRRHVIAQALGEIGDPRAVERLCQCAATVRTPEDLPAILEALGRIGGAEALACLETTIRTGRYRKGTALKTLEHAPRWEAARWAILAADPDGLSSIQAAMETNIKNPPVVAELGQLHDGLKTAARCRDRKGCYLEVLQSDATWFAREVSAFALARLAPGDLEVAEAIAAAYTVDNPDARVSMALLATRLAGSRGCPKCAAALRAELDRGATQSSEFRRAELVGRIAVARLDRR